MLPAEYVLAWHIMGLPVEEQRRRRILLHAEQGLGDTLQFVRYAPLVQQRGGFVILECQPPLVRLLAGAAGIDKLIARGHPLPDFDCHAPLLSLPSIFRTVLDTIPAAVPYLKASPEEVERWREIIESRAGAEGIYPKGMQSLQEHNYVFLVAASNGSTSTVSFFVWLHRARTPSIGLRLTHTSTMSC